MTAQRDLIAYFVHAPSNTNGAVIPPASAMPITPALGDTFTVGGSVSGPFTVTTAVSTTQLTSTGLIANGGTLSNFLGCQILFTSGANAGITATITQVTNVGLLTYAPAAGTAAVGNTFIILTNQNNGITNVNGANNLAVAQGYGLTVDFRRCNASCSPAAFLARAWAGRASTTTAPTS